MKFYIYTFITIASLIILISCSKNDIEVETNNSETNRLINTADCNNLASDTTTTSLENNKQIIVDYK